MGLIFLIGLTLIAFGIFCFYASMQSIKGRRYAASSLATVWLGLVGVFVGLLFACWACGFDLLSLIALLPSQLILAAVIATFVLLALNYIGVLEALDNFIEELRRKP